MAAPALDGEPLEWGPTLDEAACTDCGVCLEICRQGVYRLVAGRVRVVAKTSCIEGCSHCATLCEAGALSLPSLAEVRAARRTAGAR